MNVQELEEQQYTAQSPYEFEKAAVQQEGEKRASQRYLLTDFDTWVENPFWDGIDPSHPEDGPDDDGGCSWCGKDCPDAARPQGCWFPDCPDEPHNPDQNDELPF